MIRCSGFSVCYNMAPSISDLSVPRKVPDFNQTLATPMQPDMSCPQPHAPDLMTNIRRTPYLYPKLQAREGKP